MGRREKLAIDYINTRTVDIIQVQVSVPLESVEFVKSLVTDYYSYLEIPYYNLSTEIKRKKISIISILRNQLSVLKLDNAISVLPINKKDKDSSSISIELSEELEEDIENENVVIFKLDIDIKELFTTILSFNDIKEEDIWLGNRITMNYGSCKTIFALLYNLLKEDSSSKNEVFQQLHLQVVSEKKHLSQMKYSANLLSSLDVNNISRMKLDLFYKMILQIVNIVFGFTMLKINYIKPTEIFLSTLVEPNDLEDPMRVIHSILDYSQTTMDIISGMLQYNMKDSAKTILDNATNNFQNNLTPIGYNLKSNYVDIFKNSGISIDYRGLYKPHGEGYIDAGYSFFKISGDIDNYHKDIKTDKRTQLVNYLNPFNYIHKFGYKIDNTKDTNIVFAFTCKFYSLKEGLFNPINKGMVSLLNNRIEEDNVYYKIVDKKYSVPMNYITYISLQIANSNLVSNKYDLKADSSNYVFFTIDYMTRYAIQRLLLDPLKVLMSANNKTKNLILEFNIRKTVEYFINRPVLSSNYSKMVDCYKEIINLLQKYYLKDLINIKISSYKNLGLENNFTLMDVLNVVANPQISNFKDEEVQNELVESIVIIICGYIPISSIFMTNSKNSESIEFLVSLLYSYLSNTKYNPFKNKNSYAISKVCKFVSRQIATSLLEKGYISRMEYNYLSESRDMSVLNKSSINKSKIESVNYFDHTDLKSCIFTMYSILTKCFS